MICSEVSGVPKYVPAPTNHIVKLSPIYICIHNRKVEKWIGLDCPVPGSLSQQVLIVYRMQFHKTSLSCSWKSDHKLNIKRWRGFAEQPPPRFIHPLHFLVVTFCSWINNFMINANHLGNFGIVNWDFSTGNQCKRTKIWEEFHQLPVIHLGKQFGCPGSLWFACGQVTQSCKNEIHYLHSIDTSCQYLSCLIRVPTQTGKPGKMGRYFPVREFWTDWKSQGKSHKILENSGNFRQILFVIF